MTLHSDHMRVWAERVAHDLEELAGFLRVNPEWSTVLTFGDSWCLTAGDRDEWVARTRELCGSDDTTDSSDYLTHSRSFGVLTLQVQLPKEKDQPPAPCRWTGGNQAEFAAFAEAAAGFTWTYAELDGDDGRIDRSVVCVWPHESADLFRPNYVRPGDTVTADGIVIRGGES